MSMEMLIEGKEYFIKLKGGGLASATLYRCDVCKKWAYVNPAPLTDKDISENPGLLESATLEAKEIGTLPEMTVVNDETQAVGCEHCAASMKPALSRSEALFEEMIEGMNRSEAKAFYIHFLNNGLDLLSAKAQNYLVKRIDELTDK